MLRKDTFPRFLVLDDDLWQGVGDIDISSFLAKLDPLPQDWISQIDLILCSPPLAQRLHLITKRGLLRLGANPICPHPIPPQ